MNIKFQFFLFPSRIRVQRGHEIPRIFWAGIYFNGEILKFILTDPRETVLAKLKMLQGLPEPQNRELSITWAALLLLEVAPGLCLVSYSM